MSGARVWRLAQAVTTFSTAFMATALVALSAVAPVPAMATTTTTGFTVSGNVIERGGVPWVPYGFTLSAFQNPVLAYAPGEFATVAAQLRAIKGAWHGNVVRMQIEQYGMLHGGNGHTAVDFRNRVNQAVAYAESIGLAVVLNAQTEPEQGMASLNESLPTAATLAFWKLMAPRYRLDQKIIIDPFNEPRDLTGKGGAADGWAEWFNGLPSKGYIGEKAFIKGIRADGFTQQIWDEAPGMSVLTELGVTWPKYVVPDPDHNLAYSYHHAAGLQDGPPTAMEYNIEFGNLVTVRNVPVVDAEWTNRAVPAGAQHGHVYEPSGDVGQCWGGAPVWVPQYLAYLTARHIGMTVWTLGQENSAAAGASIVNLPGTDYTSANSYPAVGYSCLAPKGAYWGAGADIKAWFTSMNP